MATEKRRVEATKANPRHFAEKQARKAEASPNVRAKLGEEEGLEIGGDTLDLVPDPVSLVSPPSGNSVLPPSVLPLRGNSVSPLEGNSVSPPSGALGPDDGRPLPPPPVAPSLPPPRPIPERPSPGTALALLRDVQASRIDPKSLSTPERRALVALMLDGSRRAIDIAAFLQTTIATVRNDVSKIRAEAGTRIVRAWSLEAVVGHLADGAEKAEALALDTRPDASGKPTRNPDAGLFWAVRSGFVRQLKELGVVGQGSGNGTGTMKELAERYTRATERLAAAMENPAACGVPTGPRGAPPREVEGKALPLSSTLAPGPRGGAGLVGGAEA